MILFSILTTLILIGAKFFVPNSDWPSYVLAFPFAFTMLFLAVSEIAGSMMFLIAKCISPAPLDTFPVAPRRHLPPGVFQNNEPKHQSLVKKRYEGRTQIIDINPLLNHRKKQQNRGQEDDPA